MRALPAEDVERLAESAWWIGRVDDCIAAHERAYAAYMDEELRGAAIVAVRLAEDFINRQAKSIGMAAQAPAAAAGRPECLEHGVLLRLHAVLALESEGNVDKALGWPDRPAISPPASTIATSRPWPCTTSAACWSRR